MLIKYWFCAGDYVGVLSCKLIGVEIYMVIEGNEPLCIYGFLSAGCFAIFNIIVNEMMVF